MWWCIGKDDIARIRKRKVSEFTCLIWKGSTTRKLECELLEAVAPFIHSILTLEFWWNIKCSYTSFRQQSFYRLFLYSYSYCFSANLNYSIKINVSFIFLIRHSNPSKLIGTILAKLLPPKRGSIIHFFNPTITTSLHETRFATNISALCLVVCLTTLFIWFTCRCY